MKSFFNQVKVFLSTELLKYWDLSDSVLVVETFTFVNDHRSNHWNLTPDLRPCNF